MLVSKQKCLYIIRLYIAVVMNMEMFEAKPKPWGNSLGITIPSEIVKRVKLASGKKIKVILVDDYMKNVRAGFGKLQRKMPTQQAMDEIDEGYD